MYKYLFFLSLLLVACSNPLKTVEIRDDSGNLIERFAVDKESNLKEGLYERFDEEGHKIETAYYQQEVLNGERNLFHPNGQVHIAENHKNGQFEGAYRVFRSNGQLELEGQYIGGAMSGAWKRYYEDGQLMEVVQFKDNQENGPFEEYHANGQPKAVGNYLEGDNEEGELKLYDENGQLMRIMQCEKGRCTTKWKREELEEQQL